MANLLTRLELTPNSLFLPFSKLGSGFRMDYACLNMATDKAKQKSPATQEQIISGFQELRTQQRAVASKISELEMEKKEHE